MLRCSEPLGCPPNRQQGCLFQHRLRRLLLLMPNAQPRRLAGVPGLGRSLSRRVVRQPGGAGVSGQPLPCTPWCRGVDSVCSSLSHSVSLCLAASLAVSLRLTPFHRVSRCLSALLIVCRFLGEFAGVLCNASELLSFPQGGRCSACSALRPLETDWVRFESAFRSVPSRNGGAMRSR